MRTHEKTDGTQVVSYTCAETATLMRPVLKASFPGTKFSVRSDTYAGGASIRVAWTDGPTSAEVEAVAGLFSGATFDGMQDLKSYHDSVVVTADGEPMVVSYGADFVFCNRTLSEALVAKAEDEFKETFGFSYVPYGDPAWDSDWDFQHRKVLLNVKP